MNKYVLGGWTQNLQASVPKEFSHTMYGMVTNLQGLTTGTSASPGWSPKTTKAPTPSVSSGKIIWTYGGGFCSPEHMPATNEQVKAIVDATVNNGWDGVDFDDECTMNILKVVQTMHTLKTMQKETSFTFMAGWAYNNPDVSAAGKATNEAVHKIMCSDAADRYVLMCYAARMWSMKDIEANVGQAIDRTIEHGVPPKKVVLALNVFGLDDTNLNYFLEQVTSKEIGGLFIWDYEKIDKKHFDTITAVLTDTSCNCHCHT